MKKLVALLALSALTLGGCAPKAPSPLALVDANGSRTVLCAQRTPVKELLQASEMVCVVAADGAMTVDAHADAAFVEPDKGALRYTDGSGAVVHEVVGLIADAPPRTIGQAYTDALSFLRSGQRVLLIELDGWGWDQFERLGASQPYLSSLPSTQVLAAYPPISPVGLATLLTGRTPDAHGIHDRKAKRLQVPDLFQSATALGKTAYYVEGDATLIQTSLAPILSPDLSGQLDTDDEVMDHALQAPPTDLLVVHFHGIDDQATTFGPTSSEATERMRIVDGYVRKLVAGFSGKVIITADHGLHEVQGDPDRKGTHGIVCQEDMLVPYVVTEGGKT